MTAEITYLLCTATSALCAAMLLRGYRASGTRLLLWSSLCFVGLFLNNLMLFIDMIVLTSVDLSIWRLLPAVVGLFALCYGLVEDAA